MRFVWRGVATLAVAGAIVLGIVSVAATTSRLLDHPGDALAGGPVTGQQAATPTPTPTAAPSTTPPPTAPPTSTPPPSAPAGGDDGVVTVPPAPVDDDDDDDDWDDDDDGDDGDDD